MTWGAAQFSTLQGDETDMKRVRIAIVGMGIGETNAKGIVNSARGRVVALSEPIHFKTCATYQWSSRAPLFRQRPRTADSPSPCPVGVAPTRVARACNRAGRAFNQTSSWVSVWQMAASNWAACELARRFRLLFAFFLDCRIINAHDCSFLPEAIL